MLVRARVNGWERESVGGLCVCVCVWRRDHGLGVVGE